MIASPVKVLALLLGMTMSWAIPAAAPVPQSYPEAEAVWLKLRKTQKYQEFLSSFLKLNNQLHLDERNGCYSLSPAPVDLVLVISPVDDGASGVVRDVFARVVDAKSRCFVELYRGIRTPPPPEQPFVVQMHMTGDEGQRI